MPLPSALDLAACVDDFAADLDTLAWAIAHQIIAIELGRRVPTPEPAPRRRRTPAAPLEAVAPTAPALVVEPPPPPTPTGRRPWTRDRVVDELAQWLIDLPGLDAPSLRRRKQGALVDASKREFGRFEAALNAANLALAQKYPAGIPKAHERSRR